VALARTAVLPVVLLLAGILVAVLAHGSTFGIAVALALIGCAAVAAVAIAFYQVGRAEDREREAAEAERARREAPPAPPGPPTHTPPAHGQGLARERRRPRPPRRPS
jgi:prepilin signal peptidase PulO-like enzyme (type II secretory pathway)